MQCNYNAPQPPPATHTAHAHTHTQPHLTLGLLHLVEPVAGVRERHGHAGAHVAAGPLAVGQAGGRPLPLQRGQTGLDRLAEEQHGLGQRVAGKDKRARWHAVQKI